jgi:hypothetical protein
VGVVVQIVLILASRLIVWVGVSGLFGRINRPGSGIRNVA